MEDILCNKCGQSCLNEYKNFDGMSVVASGSYGSKHIGDGENLYFDICETCVMEFVKTFKIEPEI